VLLGAWADRGGRAGLAHGPCPARPVSARPARFPWGFPASSRVMYC